MSLENSIKMALLWVCLLFAITFPPAFGQFNLFGDSSTNKLAVGPSAKVGADLDVRLFGSMDFDGKSKAEVLQIRKQRALDQPRLLLSQYTPSDAVFGQIVDGRPWWGLQGLSLGAGTEASMGESWHSQPFCNPYALVWADVQNKTYHFTFSRFKTKVDFVKSGYPSRCTPERFTFNAKNRYAVLSYNLTNFISRCNSYMDKTIGVGDLDFGLFTYNARDFGYNYAFVDNSKSKNIDGARNEVIKLVHYFHCGPSCGMPGGCNNMSPHTAGLEDLSIKALPARCQVSLWQNEPASPTQAADFVFALDFR